LSRKGDTASFLPNTVNSSAAWRRDAKATLRQPCRAPRPTANDLENRAGAFSRCPEGDGVGRVLMAINGQAVLENVRRYRTVASLYRQTATFRPHQRASLLEQAQLWEERAVSELENYFVARDAASNQHLAYHPSAYAQARWAMAAA
jgi:hypothetical protein